MAPQIVKENVAIFKFADGFVGIATEVNINYFAHFNMAASAA